MKPEAGSRKPEAASRIDLSVDLNGIKLRNPVLLASGCVGYGHEYQHLVDYGRIGGIVTKSVSPLPRPGNPPPRIWETPAGMLNAIGLENPGVDRFLAEKMVLLRTLPTAIIASVVGGTMDEFGDVAAKMDGEDTLQALELNISCPNVSHGTDFGRDPAAAEEIVRQVRKRTAKRIIVKLTPEAPDIAAIARAAEKGGAHAISLCNTWRGLAVDVETGRPRIANVTGGFSGPAVRPLAVRLTWEVCKAVSIPVIGIGGIATASDALEFMMVGAGAVQVGTALFADPAAPEAIVDGLAAFCERKKLASLAAIRGTFRP